jgi:hypothetical protein
MYSLYGRFGKRRLRLFFKSRFDSQLAQNEDCYAKSLTQLTIMVNPLLNVTGAAGIFAQK